MAARGKRKKQTTRRSTQRPGKSPRGEEARSQRKAALSEQRREHILAGARAVFAEEGLERATMRRIADACGYTPAAIYFYFEGKEEIYASILKGVLQELDTLLRTATESGGSSEEMARRALTSLFDYYRSRPREFELSYYLFGGVQPRGLTSSLNRELNQLLEQILGRVTDTLAPLGSFSQNELWQEAVACLAHLSGVALLAHSGRLKTVKVEGDALQTAYIDQLVERLQRR